VTEQLQRDAAAEAIVRGEIDDTHAALADLVEDAVVVDALGERHARTAVVVTAFRFCERLECGRSVEKTVCRFLEHEQRVDLGSERVVALARPIEKRRAVSGTAFERRVQQLLDAVPPLRRHG